MLMVIDVGNTNTVIGVYDGRGWAKDWRIETKKGRTADEIGVVVLNLLLANDLSPEKITGIIFSCVVPPLAPVIEELSFKYMNCKAIAVGPGIKTGIPIRCENPKEVGADRIVNAVAAYEKVRGSCIVVDFGTATTFDVISRQGEFLGGTITPGIQISIEALFQRTSKLPRVKVTRPKNVIGRDTISAIQSGIIYGYAGLVDGIVRRIQLEMGDEPRVIATGGLAEFIASEARTIQEVDERLTLEGLRLLYQRNIESDGG